MKTIVKIRSGSWMFGTNTETSDEDTIEIYKCRNDDLLGLNYKEHDDLNKDYRRYELGKFIRLLINGNPNMLEVLYAPEDCILESTYEWKYLQSFRHIFLTKKIYDTFVGYAHTQIKKAKGLNKKINWENNRIVRLTVPDFCTVILPGQTNTLSLRKYLEVSNTCVKDYSLSKINHAHDTYHMYDFVGGIVGDNSNDVRVISIPEDKKPIATLVFNKDGYSKHCKEYNEYSNWLKMRNEDRYNVNKEHGQNYDSKNIMHMIRLLNTVEDVLKGKGLKVRRSPEEIEELLKIKRGEVNLNKIVEETEEKVKNLQKLLITCNLPDDVDQNLVNFILIKTRRL